MLQMMIAMVLTVVTIVTIVAIVTIASAIASVNHGTQNKMLMISSDELASEKKGIEAMDA